MLRRNRGAFSAPTQRAEGQAGHGVGSTEDQQIHDLAELRTLRAIAANRKLPARARRAAQQQLADRIVPAPVFLSGGTHYDYSGYPVFLHPPLVNRPMPAPLTQVGGPGAAGPTESQIIQAAKNRGARQGMPGEVLRSQEAQDYMRRIDEMPGAHRPVNWGAVAHLLNPGSPGKVGDWRGAGGAPLEAPIDFITGIPSYLRDPSLANAGWVAASVLPVGKVIKGASTVAKYGPRVIRAGGQEVRLAAAGSRAGRVAEKLYDKALPESLREKKIAKTFAYQEDTKLRVLSAPALAAQKVGKRLKPEEQVALLIVAEGATPEARIAAHARWKAALAESAAKKGVDARRKQALELGGRLHDVSESLVRKAAKYVMEDPAGGMMLRGDAPGELQLAWEYVKQSADTREAILRSAYEGSSTARRLRLRLDIPARHIAGATHITPEAAEQAAQQLTPDVILADDVAKLVDEQARKLVERGSKDMRRAGEEYGTAHKKATAADRRVRNLRQAVDDARSLQDELISLGERAQEYVGRPLTDPLELRTFEKLRERIASISNELEGKWRKVERYHGSVAAAAKFANKRAEALTRLGEERSAVARRVWQLRQEAEDSLAEVDALSLRQEQIAAETGWRGAEDLAGVGKAYVEHVYGIPGGRQTYVRRVVATFNQHSPGRAMSLLFRDPAMRKVITGTLAESGFRNTVVTQLTADSAKRALRIARTKDAREFLLPMSKSVDDLMADGVDASKILSDYQPVKVDPSLPAVPGPVDDFSRNMDVIRRGDLAAIEPGMLDNEFAEGFYKNLFPDATAKLLHSPNIRWVNTHLLSRVLSPPAGPRNVYAKAGRVAVEGFNVVSDMNRMAILYFNPAYIPVNLLGNVALNLMDEGVLAFRDWGKAFRASKTLAPIEVAFIDAGVGSGLTHSLQLRTSVKTVFEPYTNLVHTMTDMIPRRAAFYHHAAKSGLKTPEQISATIKAALAGDKDALALMNNIFEKANDAMVDFNRLSPVERDVISKLIFVYPWLKGATRYSARFPLEHPVEAAVTGWAGWNVNEQRKERGPAPYYTYQLVNPVKFAGQMIPGGRGDTVEAALAEWFPWLNHDMDLSKFLPIGVPAEHIERIVQLWSGSRNLPSVLGAINPAGSAFLGAVQGVDPENPRHEYKGNFLSRFAQAEEGSFAPWRTYKNLTTSAEDEKNRIRPQTQGQKIAEAFIGGAAPGDVNKKVAAERVAEPLSRPDRAAADARKYRTEFVQDWKRAGLGDTIPVEVNRAIDNQNAVRVAEAQLAVRLAGSKQAQAHFEQINENRTYVHSLTPRQRLAVRLNRMRRVGLKAEADQLQEVLDSTPDSMKPFIVDGVDGKKGLLDIAEAFLGYGLVDEVKRDMREIDQAEQLRVATEVTVG